MALVAATLQVNFTAIYVGQHRVCWRIVGAPTFTCTNSGTHPNCVGGGLPCAYDIPITVDDETCVQVDYEGYVQPACEDEISLVGRIPFLVSFIPDPACNRYRVLCDNSVVDSIVVDNPGSGYDYTSLPSIVISGGGGAGATADAVIGDGDVTGLVISVAGTGYSDGVYPGTSLTGGTGTGATADITVVGGVITVANVATPGDDYVTGDILAPDTGVVGVPTLAAQLTATSDLGTLLSVTLTAPGSLYTTAPTVTIDPPPGPGTTALAHSILVGCTQVTIQDCDGVTVETIAAGYFQPGEATFMCGTAEPTVPSDFSVSEIANCLCECTDYDIENTGGDTIDAKWIDCNDVVQTTTLNSGGGPTNICAVTDSVTYTLMGAGTAVWSITDNGACSAP